MTITAKPWKGERDRWQVYVGVKWADGSMTKERKVIKAATEAKALRWGKDRHAAIVSEGQPEQMKEEGERPPAVPTVADFSETWVRDELVPTRKAQAVKSIRSILRLHVVPFIGSKPLDQVTDPVVAALRAKWLEIAAVKQDEDDDRPALAPSTMNNRLTVISSMVGCAVKWKVIPAMPCTISIEAVDHDEAPFLSVEEYERLVEAARQLDPRAYCAVLLGGDAGLRIGEVMGANKEDFDLVKGTVRVRRTGYIEGGKQKSNEPKGKKKFTVSITPRLVAAVRAVYGHLRGARLLYMDDGRPLTTTQIGTWMRRAYKKAGLPACEKFHILRHTYISHQAMAGIPAVTIQRQARHASLKMTQRYMHLSPQAVDQGVDMLVKSRAQGGTPVLFPYGNVSTTISS